MICLGYLCNETQRSECPCTQKIASHYRLVGYPAVLSYIRVLILPSKTCRGRRVKCDETRPICNNCARKNRSCTYEDAPSSTGTTTSEPGPLRRSKRAYPQDDGQNAKDSSSGQQDTSYHSLGAVSLQADLPQGERNWGGISPESQRDALLSSNGLDAIDLRGLEIPTALRDSSSPNLAAIFSHVEKPPPYAPSVEPPIPVTLGFASDRGRGNSEDRSIALVQEQIELSAAEVTIFRNYVERVSRWVYGATPIATHTICLRIQIDSFSRDQPFYRKVPIMALRCPVLMNSCLALSMKQSTLKASGDEQRIRENAAIHYHQKAIKALSTLLADTECASRDEILASSIILSTYVRTLQAADRC